ncbi:alpha-N-acetylglucosaminidase [Oceaniferula spumae]|uniref:Alpha-N-acetylglucosaminidase n=1 Tax=Oceaniferula spumae TaxID=2979115 RepID=A0AAT9FKM1_9BACT
MRPILTTLLAALLSAISCHASDEVSAARGVLERTFGDDGKDLVAGIEMKLVKGTPNQPDSYAYHAKNGKLTLEGTSPVAICRAAYDYLKANNLGTVGWAGPRLRLPDGPDKWPDAPLTQVTSPFQWRHCYNAVTSGYTTPYWTWERWEQELDWLALHGFNMVMAPVAFEAIEFRVWKQMGLTDQEISDFDTGPAHLPWLRMGCISNVGGDLNEAWHNNQIALQKKLLARMRELGIEPVVQGFGGFVPHAMKRLHPDVRFENTLWNGGFPPSQRPYTMLPDTPLWGEIMRRCITEWKKEFGEAKYWLVDSFNELQLPNTGEPPAEMLARFGKATFDAIRSADPDAVWVLQGWMFNYQRDIWNKDTVKGFVNSVPANDLIVLDYANDYNPNWDDFSAFHGRLWMMGYVPNMGGKTAYCGKMQFYADQAANTLASKERGNLTGFTISGEGLENNEILYELMSDTAWTSKPVDLDTWLPNYIANRYGRPSDELAEAWNGLRNSVYNNFTPHPSYGWQKMQLAHGSSYRGAAFPSAIRKFLAQAEEFGSQSNYRDDAVEMAAQALALKADEWLVCARELQSQGDVEGFKSAVDHACKLLLQADQLLESHSYLTLENWIAHARNHEGTAADKDAWEANAKQLITIWGPPVNDYSCRVWSGLIRDFYVPRMQAMTSAMAEGKNFDRRSWERNWVDSTGISKIKKLENPAASARDWVEAAYQKPVPSPQLAGDVIGTWEPGKVTTDWTEVEWPLDVALLNDLAGVRFQFTGGNHRLDIRKASIIADGKAISTDKHDGEAGEIHRSNIYRFNIPKGTRANNTLVLKAEVRSLFQAQSNGKIFAIKKK